MLCQAFYSIRIKESLGWIKTTCRTLDACAFRLSFNPEIGLTIVAGVTVYNQFLNAGSRFDDTVLRSDLELESPAAEIGIEVVDGAPAIMCPDASISTLT